MTTLADKQSWPMIDDEDKIATPSLSRLASLMDNDLRIVGNIIAQSIQSRVSMIPLLADHLLGGGGKRLRPMLTLACARLLGYEGTLHHNLAAAIELLHNATLLHDDVVDGSTMRRSRETANVIWGARPPIFVGDFLLAQSFCLIIDTGLLRALGMLSEAATRMARGELGQMDAVGYLNLAEARYFEVIDAKTADLFSIACRMAATVIRSDEAREAALEAFGRNIGLAFQLVDDAIDYSSDSEAIGKAIGDDFREGKVTLPVILSYRNGGPEARHFWESVISGEIARDDGALAEALRHMKASGAISDTLDRARDHAQRAKQAIEGFGDSAIKTALMEAADFAVARSF